VKLEKVMIHPFLFAVFPVISLLGRNITEVSLDVVFRPLIISLVSTTILFLVLKLLCRNSKKAALITSFCLLIFYTYGQIYDLLKNSALNAAGLARHRYLIPVFLGILLLGLFLIFKKLRDYSVFNHMLNLVAVFLLIFPIYQVVQYSITNSVTQSASANWTPQMNYQVGLQQSTQPDVYYIILDGYSRDDVLLTQFGFDNSEFLDQLKELGFVIAECSRSNYDATHTSLLSSLNMDQIRTISDWAKEKGISGGSIWSLIKDSLVRKQFEALGYKIVAFDTGFEWTRLKDADLYLSRTTNPTGMQWVSPFEAILIDSTVLSIYTDWQSRNYQSQFSEYVHPKSYFINQELYKLSELPKIAEIQDATFTFAHILIPHAPFVFSPNGILTDPGYYGGNLESPTNSEYFNKGYISEIQFDNQQMISILTKILENSSTPPIIIIQADHGLASDRFPILNAYYLPNGGSEKIYSTITPVNTFRLIFDTYFGGNYGLIPDVSYSDKESTIPIFESQPFCSSTDQSGR
jgi:hypothetical protein